MFMDACTSRYFTQCFMAMFPPHRIPLVPRRPKSGDVIGTWKEMKAKKSTPRREMTKMSEEKLDSPIPPADLDEKVDIQMNLSLQFVSNLLSKVAFRAMFAKFIKAVSS